MTPSTSCLQITGLLYIKVKRGMSHEIHPLKRALYGRTFILLFNDFFCFLGDNILPSFRKNIEGLIAPLESECDP